MKGSVKDIFDLSGKVAIITGGAGLLGGKHAEAIAEAGGIPVLYDIDGKKAEARAGEISAGLGVKALGQTVDITQHDAVSDALAKTLAAYGRVDILINNAANNPRAEDAGISGMEWSRFENYPLETWHQDLAIGLTGAFICSQVIGGHMASSGGGVILNIASDLGLIAPDQRIYQQPGLPEHLQPVKPVSYSVVKGGLLILTKYLATYWADKNVRVNALSPGGVYDGQSDDFVQRLTNLIPMKRMANKDEYKAAIVFLCSDASSYMTGANLVVDGGRTVW